MDAVDASVRPEIKQDDFPCQGFQGEGIGGVQPIKPGWKLGCGARAGKGWGLSHGVTF